MAIRLTAGQRGSGDGTWQVGGQYILLEDSVLEDDEGGLRGVAARAAPAGGLLFGKEDGVVALQVAQLERVRHAAAGDGLPQHVALLEAEVVALVERRPVAAQSWRGKSAKSVACTGRGTQGNRK